MEHTELTICFFFISNYAFCYAFNVHGINFHSIRSPIQKVMARTKQTNRRSRKQTQPGTKSATPPAERIGFANGDRAASEQTRENTDVSLTVGSKPTAEANLRTTAYEEDKASNELSNRLPYLPSFEVNGFEKEIKIHINRWGAPRRLKYCLDCVRMHVVAWCDGTFEEVSTDCEYHATK